MKRIPLPRQYGIAALLLAIAFSAIVFACIANYWHAPRTFPQVRIVKRIMQRNGEKVGGITLVVYFAPDEYAEEYADAFPLGTLNYAYNKSLVRPYQFHEELLGTPKEHTVQEMPSVYEARYQYLLARISKDVDISKQPSGWQKTFVLESDYPAFAEFQRDYNAQFTQRDTATRP